MSDKPWKDENGGLKQAVGTQFESCEAML